MAHVDLHTHSTASDGTDSPAELLALAAEVGLAALALTDHDTVAGIAEARAAAEPLGVELIPGIEISAVTPGREDELHILGLFIDERSPAIRRMNEMLLAARDQRNESLLARLEQLGKPVSRDELDAMSEGIVSRSHIAQLMVRRGYVKSVRQAFDRHIGPGGDAWFEKARLTFSQAFETIHGAGGLAVLAHPRHYEWAGDAPARLDTLIGRMADAGLDGLEAFHPDQSPEWTRRIMRQADRFGLAVTGGSDYHGLDRVGRPLNSQRVDAAYLEKLRGRLAAVAAGGQQ